MVFLAPSARGIFDMGKQKTAPSASGETCVPGGPVRDAKGRFLPRGGVAKSDAGPLARPAPRRWSAKAEGAFLEALAESGNVARSCRIAGVSDNTVYRQRAKSEAFRTRWAEALREGYAKLEALVLDRALNGYDKPVYQGGKKVGTTRHYDNRTALTILRMHAAAVHGTPSPEVAGLSVEEMRRIVAGRLALANKRMGGRG